MAENYTNKQNEETEEKKPKKPKKNGMIEGRTLGILTGLVLIAAGVGYIGNIVGLWSGFTIFFNGWWTLFIIIPCLAGVLDCGLGSYYTAGLLVGIVFLVFRLGLIDSIWKLAIPTLLIYIGLRVIFRNKPFGFRRIVNGSDGRAYFIPVYRGYFAPRSIVIPAGEDFVGAEVMSLFAPVEIDLTGVRVSDEAALRVTALFAPASVRVNPEINLLVQKKSGVSKLTCEAKNYSDLVNMPTLHISAACVFAPVTVKN